MHTTKGFRTRLFHHGPPPPPDIPELQQKEDVEGLTRALRDESPDVVEGAANAIAFLYRHSDNEVTRQQAAAAARELLHVLERFPSSIQVHVRPYANRFSDVQVKMVSVLGAIRAPEAESLLLGLLDRRARVQDLAAEALGHVPDAQVAQAERDPDVRLMSSAARALGRVPGHGHAERLEPLLRWGADELLRIGAAEGLGELGGDGLPILRDAILSGDPVTAEAAKKGLSLVPGLHGRQSGEADAAQAILEEANRWEEQRRQAEAETRRRETEQRETAKRVAVEERLRPFPVATKLARLLGNWEWAIDGHVIKPSTEAEYNEALALCKSLGLNVEQHQETLDVEHGWGTDDIDRTVEVETTWAKVWATVEFEGETFVIEGGLRRWML